jgi:FtsH-binding integral membrane protein
MLLAIVSSLFGSVNWLLAQNELEGRPYWILSLSGFALISYLHGQSSSVLVWGVLMVIIGGWTFLSESHSRKIDFLLPVVLLTIAGLPFTPAAAGMAGISTGPLSIFNPLLWISLAILMAGLVKFSLRGGDNQHPYENWMQFFFSVGMRLMVLSSWSILLFKDFGWNQTDHWWVSLIVLIIFTGIQMYTYVEAIHQRVQSSKVFTSIQLVSPSGQVINRFFHFSWLYRLLGFLFGVQKAVVDGFNLVFEGESGILWALVFLVLLASLLINGKGG